MTLSSPESVIPGEHLIVIAARRPDVAQGCAEALTRAGYPVVVCREESTGFPVVEAVEKHCPHLLIVDDDIEWADGIHVAQRLHADPVFANLYVLVLLRLGIGIPNWMWGDWSRNSQITKPFNPAELVFFVRRILELIIAGEAPPFPDPKALSARSAVDWETWKQQVFPFAFFTAARFGDRAYLETCIAQGIDVSLKNAYGSTALHCADEGGHEDVILLLLQQGAEVDALSDYGISPLWLAACNAHDKAMHLLLQWGADPNAVDWSGETALQRAQKHNMQAIEQILREYGAQR